MKKILAIDIGGPIIQRPAHSSLDEYRAAEPVANSFATLNTLSYLFKENIHLISQCNQDLQDVKIDWMQRHNFHILTNIPLDRVHFVREPHQKALLAEELQATHFVEDRAEILNYALLRVDHLYLFRPNVEEASKYPLLLRHADIVINWDALFYRIDRTL
ncbi:MAG TPA: hypothetical protein VM577_00720 [Anaerovoracaceae bacterium]|nr:hypothetical protein [Anaerovoracaceae bacterium]